MFGKFRPPLLEKVEQPIESDTILSEPMPKRRKVDVNEQNPAIRQLIFKRPGISSLPRKPLLAVLNPAATVVATQPPGRGAESYYNVLW